MDRRDANQLSKFAKVEREVTAALANDLRTYAVRRWPSMNHEWRKAKLASMLGMRVRRLRSFWDAEETLSPRQSEVQAIKALIGQGEEEDAALSTRIAELEERVAFLLAVLDREEMEAASAEARFALGSTSERRGRLAGRRSTD